MAMSQRVSAGWAPLARGLFLVAMALFVVTVAIGIVNGLDLYEFNHDQLLTHVHSGTLGWITLGLVAAIVLDRPAGRPATGVALAILIPIYVAAFFTGNLPARAITGTLLLVAVLWTVVWAWKATEAGRSLPGLAVALGLTTFTYGAVIGVLIQIQLASGAQIFPKGADIVGAHAATMAFSYLVLMAMGLIEWRTKGTTNRPRGGLVQVGVLFVGGALLACTFLFITDPAAAQGVAGLDGMLQIVAVILFAVRVLPAAVRTDWMAAGPGRYLGDSALFVIVAIGIFLYLISLFISSGDPSKIPAGVLVANDHSVFIGVTTNLLLGLAFAFTADRPTAERDRRPDRLLGHEPRAGRLPDRPDHRDRDAQDDRRPGHGNLDPPRSGHDRHPPLVVGPARGRHGGRDRGGLMPGAARTEGAAAARTHCRRRSDARSRPRCRTSRRRARQRAGPRHARWRRPRPPRRRSSGRWPSRPG